jgi:hypothetical protein
MIEACEALMTDDSDISDSEGMYRVVDAAFRLYAEENLASIGLLLSVEKAHQTLWQLFERGKIRLVSDNPDSVRVEYNNGSREERRAYAAQIRWLVLMNRMRNRAPQ